jgi:DNA invertase Pin-like site-specific DNA recombinase
MTPHPPRKLLRCAIYTRKSTEHNLDLEFNSLDAQREACEAYIKSQAHEGWRLVRTGYDDGGLSGASLDRPALPALPGAERQPGPFPLQSERRPPRGPLEPAGGIRGERGGSVRSGLSSRLVLDLFHGLFEPCNPFLELRRYGVRTIIVESPDRFARDLAVQLAGHDFLKNPGVALIPASAPDFFLEDTPTAVLVRQVLGAIAQFEKASLVAELKAARDRKIAQGIKCGGRKSYAEREPELVAAAKELSAQRPRLSLRGYPPSLPNVDS